ncbi:hypothetical protein ACFPAF_19850 [Hymenobacter endophyticus]|uniref:Uncharacterized protein n=1 Tax=Hymenobacter endophyticus TaxID=3076335 RepID=A0ABU3TMQ0_9BACT|nr:hypothetical protein [Hymenobacter endophyticus]MDU0372666.1 hypothetical protein [Hymenobacter endophyticus]
MLDLQLTSAGFFEISGPVEPQQAGSTYVRPRRTETVRIFIPAGTSEVEVYAGTLRNSRLVFQGPVEQALSLPWLLPLSN